MPPKLSKEDTLNDFIRVHGNKFIYDTDTYINATTNMKIICPEGHTFLQTPTFS